ncbi:hypothetical protein [Streptococcus danieliae]|nr:hypothetical protein [Streptococcus danieliae]
MKWILIGSSLFLIILSLVFAYCCCLVSGGISRLEEEKEMG